VNGGLRIYRSRLWGKAFSKTFDTSTAAGSAESLARVLGRVARLFSSPLPLPLALQSQQEIPRTLLVSEFHSFVINFSAEHKLPRFLVTYLASHNLAVTGSDAAVDLPSAGSNAPWVSMLLHFRVPSRDLQGGPGPLPHQGLGGQ